MSKLYVNSIYSKTGASEAINIDSSGNVTASGTLSHSYVYAQGSHSSNVTATSLITLDTNRESSGGATFVDSNTAIQVPISGLYLLGFHTLGNAGSGNMQMRIKKNGNIIAGSRAQDTNSSNDGVSLNIFKVLAANDKISFEVNAGASHGNSSFNNFYVVRMG